MKFCKQIDYFSERNVMRHGRRAVFSVFGQNGFQTVKLTAMFFVFKRVEHLGNKVVYVKQFKFRRSVIDRYGQIVCNVVAERCNGGIVIRSAPFSEEIRKAINKHFCTRFFCIVKKQFFAREFGLAVIRLSVSADKRRLHGRRKHNGASIFCFFERKQEC